MARTRLMSFMCHLGQFSCMLLTCLVDGVRYHGLCLRSPAALAAENLFLRKQLVLYQERHVKPRRPIHATRVTLVWLARRFDWRQALAVVEPQTLIRWHRQGFQLFWRWTSRPGRPPIPADLCALIQTSPKFSLRIWLDKQKVSDHRNSVKLQALSFFTWGASSRSYAALEARRADVGKHDRVNYPPV